MRTRVLVLAVVALSGFALAGASACHATSSQVGSTFVDGAKAGACVIAQVLSGNTDPMLLTQQCGGATLSLIIDVIDDFEAQQVGDGAPPALAMSSDQHRLLETAKQNAVAALARRAPGK